MEKIKARTFSNNRIELASTQEIEKVFTLLEKEDNFILEWKDITSSENKTPATLSVLIIGTEIYPKVKTGNIILCSNNKEGN